MSVPFMVDGSGPGLFPGELLPPHRQPDPLADQHDHRHEYGKHPTRLSFTSSDVFSDASASMVNIELELECYPNIEKEKETVYELFTRAHMWLFCSNIHNQTKVFAVSQFVLWHGMFLQRSQDSTLTRFTHETNNADKRNGAKLAEM